MDTAQAEFSDAALAVWAYLEGDPSEPLADFALGPMRSAGPGKVMFDLIDLRERRELVDSHRAAQQPLELLAPAPEKVAQPPVRHRGPRRGHVGVTRRPAGKRTAGSKATRAGPSELAGGDEPPGEPEQLDTDAWLAERRRVLGALIAGWRA